MTGGAEQATGQDGYAAVALAAVQRLVTSQRTAIGEAAGLVSRAVGAGGIIQAYGTGHSRAVTLELVGRAGGLVPANQLAIRDLVYYGGEPPETILDPLVERDPELAHRIWALADIRPADVFVIVSQSGGNGSVVEMALLAHEHGHPVIAVTSLLHTSGITSRHRSGKRLVDLADVVIDNGSPPGDAALPLPDGDAVGPLSGLTGILIAQLLVTETAARLQAAGVRPPLFRSLNTPGTEDHNAELLARYGSRVRLGDA